MPTTISGTIGVSQVQDNSIGTTDLVDGSVTTTKHADGSVTPAKLSQPLTLATAQNTTSGTSIDFTGIPSWVKRITVMFNGMSTSGASNPQVQIGSGTITTSGYSSVAGYIGSPNISGAAAASTGFVISSGAAANTLTGQVVLNLVSGNLWVCSYIVAVTNSPQFCLLGMGSVTLSGTLDRVRITTVNGTDTFDAGSVNILYEG